MEKKTPCALKRGAALLLAALLLSAIPLPIWADKKGELADGRDAASSSLAQEEKELKEKEEELRRAQGQGKTLKEKQQEITDQIYQLSETMGQLDGQVEQARREVEEKQAEYDGRWESYKEMVGGMQALHDGGQVAFLMQAKSLYQLLTFSDTLRQMSQAQDDALNQLKAQREELSARRQLLEELEAALRLQKEQLDAKVAELSGQIQQQGKAIDKAQADQKAQEVAVAAARAAFDKAADEYDAYIRAQIDQGAQDNTLFCGLDFQPPLDSYSFISCRFGEADGWTGKPHSGTDFAANTGSTIRAAADGVVQVAGGSESYSYGYYVIIYHGRDDAGRTIATLYAHMNEAPPVSVGQAVAKGDAIGRVGNTGYSRGYHLHLELRVDGDRRDPSAYIPS